MEWKKMNRALIFLFCAFTLSCGDPTTPKPKGEMRVSLPEHEYQKAEQNCPYIIEIPTYAFVVNKDRSDSSCWSDIRFPVQRATIHLTYRTVDNRLAQLLDESLGLTYEHHILADNIEDKRIILPENDVYGTVSYVYGNVASNVQFYVTDSTKHFLRGSLYFNAPPNKDSLAPVVEHFKVDIDHLLGSVRWKD